MKLIEALEICRRPVESRKSKSIRLVCGFTPLHLATYVRAHARLRFPEQQIVIEEGLYGDFLGNLERAGGEVLAVIEWDDLDPRLGYRQAAGWGSETKTDILATVERNLQRVYAAIAGLSKQAPVTICGPTLPLPPIGHTGLSQQDVFEIQINRIYADALARLSALSTVRIVSDQRLAVLSPLAKRFSVQSLFSTGLPYTLPHADAVASLLVQTAFPTSPKKAIITDLDDTLWCGIIGDAGIDGVHWAQEHHSQHHAVYQQFLDALAERGVMVGVASKNDAAMITEAFGRRELLLKTASVFPFEVNWGRKSASVARMLKAWNIGPEAVVFVDDNPMEIAEVQAEYPEITCIPFPGNVDAFPELLERLRDLFSKPVIQAEDKLRIQSLRANQHIQAAAAEHSSSDFLRDLDGAVTIDFIRDVEDSRPLELINKTSQFNLNGERLTGSDWAALIADPNVTAIVVSYRDKFGPLGKIAVLVGVRDGATLRVKHWIMSCRAFSRRIEYHTIDFLLRTCGFEAIEFEFRKTDRNGPTSDFFKSVGLTSLEEKLVFSNKLPLAADLLPHRVGGGSSPTEISLKS